MSMVICYVLESPTCVVCHLGGRHMHAGISGNSAGGQLQNCTTCRYLAGVQARMPNTGKPNAWLKCRTPECRIKRIW